MALKFTSTKTEVHTAKIVVYGPSGVGKTTLAKTCPKPVIISSEHRLLSLSDANIPVIMVEDHHDLEEAYNFVAGPKGRRFETVVIDSISDIAETLLSHFKENPEDGNRHKQAAYGSLADSMLPLIKMFRDIEGKHVYMIAKQKLTHDEYNGITVYSPSLPGQVLPQALPYLFDFVLPLRIGETENGKKYRYLQTQEDMQYIAKECSGRLNRIERPHLGNLFDKILKPVNIGKSETEEKTEKPIKQKKQKPENDKNTDTIMKEEEQPDNGKDVEEEENRKSGKCGEAEKGDTGTDDNDNVETNTGNDEGENEEVSDAGSFDIAD